MSNDLLYVEGHQGIPPPGGMAGGEHGTQMSKVWDMGVPTHWGGSGNVSYGLDRGV